MTPNDPISDEEPLRQHLINFYSVLEEKLKSYRDAKQHLDRFLSTDFNVFEWIKLNKNFESNENRLSEIILSKIIANLLNPSGSHGQGRIFLDAFLHLDAILRRIKPNDLDSLLKQQQISVTCERRTVYIENSQRRIDILIDFKNFGLGIENKPWAVDQEKQVWDYSRNLQKEFKGNFCLLYLTLEGGDPSKDSIDLKPKKNLQEKNQLIPISYRHDMLKWIKECCRLCESDKFQWFLRDFIDYIPTIPQERPMGDSIERNLIFNHALENEKNLEIVFKINSAFDDKLELHRRIIVQFLDKLEKFVLNELGDPDMLEWDVNKDKPLLDSPLDQYNHFSFRKKSWGTLYGVGLQPHEANACEVIIGVWRQYNETTRRGARRFTPRDRLTRELNAKIRNGDPNGNPHWEWCHPLDAPYRNWNTKEALIKLYNGEAAQQIGQKLVDIIKVAAPIIDKHVQKS